MVTTGNGFTVMVAVALVKAGQLLASEKLKLMVCVPLPAVAGSNSKLPDAGGVSETPGPE